MYTVLLPPGDNPIAVNKYIKTCTQISCVLMFCTTFVRNNSHSQKNSARCYHKYL